MVKVLWDEISFTEIRLVCTLGNKDVKLPPKASLSGGFMTQLLTNSYFRNSAKEFYPRETISASIKLSSSLSSSPCQHI
jgi:hypothetical protein